MNWITRQSTTGGFLLLAASVFFGATGCKRHPERGAQAREDLLAAPVRVQAVSSRKVAANEEIVGTVRAKLRATIEAKTSGRITEMPVSLGQKVTAGQLLARLDAPEIKARLEQADASLLQAEREWNRISVLFKERAATRSDYDSAEARLLAAKAGVAEARAMFGYIEIQAPFDGVVTHKWVDVGDLAAPGKKLVDLEEPARLQFEADVPEAMADKILPAAKMNVRLGRGTNDLSAAVAEIAPIADPVSRTFRVKLELPHIQGVLSGQFGRLIVPLGETPSLQVPSSALDQRGQMEIIFVAEKDRARLHLVKSGRHFDGQVEILAGLDSGDIVVIENASQLVDGQPLTTR